MIARGEFLVQLGIGEETLETWCAAGWISDAPGLTEAELARAALIRELTETLGVNEEGVDVALTLLDQLHGLRRALRAVSQALETLPPAVRDEIQRTLRETGSA